MLTRIHLERHESDKNLHRFYQLHVTPGIFEDWALVREWGRVGSPGTVRKDWFETEEKALTARQRLVEAKQKKGYQSMG
ncbi:WGR domain-containing protein [Candidatus Methylobacter favarea]|uniref:WGR domain-containing protein n=1 Tax=Candidatus Methylobacter favarea TaxID=2707345 RepID=UPI001FE45555|nr:WGR domain-containing protein [Candidatus Methylobacter favarea]